MHILGIAFFSFEREVYDPRRAVTNLAQTLSPSIGTTATSSKLVSQLFSVPLTYPLPTAHSILLNCSADCHPLLESFYWLQLPKALAWHLKMIIILPTLLPLFLFQHTLIYFLCPQPFHIPFTLTTGNISLLPDCVRHFHTSLCQALCKNFPVLHLANPYICFKIQFMHHPFVMSSSHPLSN